MARLHIAVMFAVGMLIASCDPVPAAEPTVKIMKTKSGKICGKTESSQWHCTKE